MNNYVEGNDPITELFKTEPHEDSDIQVINRNAPTNQNAATVNNNNNNNLSLTPLFDSPQLHTGYDNNQVSNDNIGHIELPTGHTPLFSPVDLHSSLDHGLMSHDLHNQMVINSNYRPQIQQLKQYQELQRQEKQQQQQIQFPALPPLSESAIPNGLSLTPSMIARPDIQRQIVTQPHPPASSSKRKRETPGTKTRPAFVMKIWSMVNDPSNQEYIRWNEDGKTFQVFYREEFMKKILPKYFKHNNFASFVRQLNMYGWHKVQDINNGTLNQNVSKEKGGIEETWKFENPNFIRHREDLLEKIVRNKGGEEGGSGGPMNEDVSLALILKEMESIKMNQYAITEDLRRVRKDNKTLWSETYLTRERSQTQARTLDRILKFLTTVYGSTNAGKILEVDQGQFNQMMTQYRPQPQPRAPPIPTSAPNAPYYRPRLMLTEEAHQQGNSPPSAHSNQTGSSLHRENSTPGSIEEIIRSYNNDKSQDKSHENVNNIYQQLVNSDPTSLSSPRHFYPELHGSNIPTESIPHTNFGIEEVEDDDIIKRLEQNISKEKQSIEQVQDWIETLAKKNENKNSPNDEDQQHDDDFDVNEFLEGTTTPVNVPTIITPGSNATPSESTSRKRSIQEIYDGNEY
ncbi:Heat shock transcription factor [Spathaspora sp. JA1]|nr:Heat shock transcription factor [Spathaspora sp. JA1]